MSSRSSATSATTSRCSGCTSRPTSTPSSTRSPGLLTRSAAGDEPARAGRRSRLSRAWGGEDWFRLGDLDLGLHLVRTSALRDGAPLSEVTASLAERVGLATRILPATDDRLRTHVETPAGEFPFQEWFVGRGHRDEVDAVRFEGAESATPAPGVLEALAAADAILVAPSNPYVSIAPILAVAGDPRGDRAPARALGRREPADRGQGGQGPGRPYALAHGRRDDPRPRRRYATKGSSTCSSIDAADGPASAPVELVATKTLMGDRDAAGASPRSCWRLRARSDRRAERGRSAEPSPGGSARRASRSSSARATRDRAAALAAELGVEGAANEHAVRGSRPRRARDQRRCGTRDRSGAPARTSATTPVLSVASELRFTPGGVLPSPEATSLAERIQAELDGPVVAGLHSLAASTLGCGRAPAGGRARLRGRRRRQRPSRSTSRSGSPPAGRTTPARSRALARSRA